MEDEKIDTNSESKTEPNLKIPNEENNEKNISSENIEMNTEYEEKITTLKNAVTKFLSEHTIYEAIPEDMKILVFNDELLIKDSIEAMIKEDIYCGLLYNSEQNKHSGIFTGAEGGQSPWAALSRNSPGVWPVSFLKFLEKWPRSL